MPDVDTQGAVEAAFDQLSSAEPEAPDTSAPDSGHDAPEPSDHDAVPVQDSERSRDGLGRFSKAAKARVAAKSNEAPRPTDAGAQDGADAGAPDASDVVAAPAAPPAPVLPELKPPQDWRAAAKDKWKDLPREVQEETGRVYAETRKVLDENAQLRKATEPLRQTFAQHEHVLRSAGAPVHQVVGGLLRTLGVLQTGHPQARADVVASLARAYLGTDESALRLLAAALDAAPQTSAAQAPQALTPQQVVALVRQERAAGEQQGKRESAIRAWQEFEGANPEFLGEPGIRASIRELVVLWQGEHPGEVPSKDAFQKLYDRACQLNEGVAKVQQQRKEAAAAKAKASTPAAAAAAGLKSEPTGPAGQGKTKSTFDEVARQYDRLSRPARV